MIKKLLILILLALFLPTVIAINLDVQKQNPNEVSIVGLENPTTFNLEITNNGKTDEFRFYNLFGFTMEPTGRFKIESNETKNIELIVYPRESFSKKGYFVLEYFIKDTNEIKQAEKITIKFVELKDAFEIGSESINPESNTITLFIKNLEDYDFNEVNATFSSPFFNIKKNFDIGPNEKEKFDVTLNKEDFNQLTAGFYTLNAEIISAEQKANLEGLIKFEEKNILISTSRDFGWFVNKKIIKKTNEGNVITATTTEIKKNIISRLFTAFSPEPDIVERKGFEITYTWNREIKPGQSLDIAVKTNWFYPFIIIILIIVITVLAKQYSLKPIQLNKKVSFVKTKGGEFALKVTIKIKARKFVERINIVDKLPALVKLYHKFGVEHPSKIDEQNRKLEWNFNSLTPGEARVVSYIVFSKVGVLGKFALPSATAVYEKDNKIHEVYSNKAFFVSEQQIGAEEEEW